MSGKNGDANLESAVYGFRVLYSGLLHAIDSGALIAVPAPKDWNGPNVEVADRRFMLDESSPGALAAVLAEESRKITDHDAAVEKLFAIAKAAIVDNERLRALLSPLETAVMFTKRDASNEIESVSTFKKIR